MGKDAYVHRPVTEGECTACHGELQGHSDNPKKHKFERAKNLDKICYLCHERFEAKKFIHVPVKEEECIACHNPHGSPYRFQLVAQGSALCFQCHEEGLLSGNYVHGPAAAGGCIACHDPHAADYAKNLKEDGPELCFACHSEMGAEFRSAKVIHKPVAENCLNCHNPHSGRKKFMLGDEAPTLCFKCHEEKKEWIMNAEVQHGALITGNSCLNCHNPHSSNIEKRLSMAPLDLCLSCHDKELKTPDGKLLTNMKKLLEENKDHHGPIRQKNCAGCHNPHGSHEFRLLKEKYPSSFYTPYRIENFELCFKCHEEEILQHPATTKLTDFRNGENNLHFKHINKPDKGRTCRACHETHASNHPKHIRDSVPFGKWEFPLNYVKTETGGSCSPGCHELRKYDRLNAADNK